MAQQRLLEVERKDRWRGSKALVPVGRWCPNCGAPVVESSVIEDALLRHGGYGASRQTRRLECSQRRCLWGMTLSVSEVRPPRVRR